MKIWTSQQTDNARVDLPKSTALAWLRYQRFPTFSPPWLWRRTALFAPLIIVLAALAGRVHGRYAHSAAEGFAVGWRTGIVYLLLIVCGPLLATVALRLRIRETAKQIMLVLAIVIGFFATDIAGRWSSEYHNMLMNAHQGHKMSAPTIGTQVEGSPLDVLYRVIVSVGVYFAFGGGIALSAYFNEQLRSRELQQRQQLEALTLQKTLADAHLSVLQAQIEPHFLFNTMASARSLIHEDPQRAEATIDALVDHLRATLPKLRSDSAAVHSTLAVQMEICRSYLDVMQVRMGTRFSYSIDLPAHIAETAFPPLMLISLVENAIKHGIEPKRGVGSIAIVAREKTAAANQFIEVTVNDDGLGIKQGPSEGMGLANIRAQLAIRYGNHAHLTLTSREGEGTLAQIVVPLEAAAP